MQLYSLAIFLPLCHVSVPFPPGATPDLERRAEKRLAKKSHHRHRGKVSHLSHVRCDREVDELVDEWTPEALGAPLIPEEQIDLASVLVVAGANGLRPKLANTGKKVLNLASYSFTGLAGNETIKVRMVETFRKYGVGSCGPPGFYSAIGASVCCQCALAVTNGFSLQMSTWISSAT